MRDRPLVAIDGPAGAGKSTASKRLADRLGFVLVDTGALYRGVALAAQEAGVSWDDAGALGELTEGLALTFAKAEGDAPRLFIDGADRSGAIRTPEMSRGASDVSRHPTVRTALLSLQRRLGAAGGVVVEGRDIGTVVFPDAEVKIFLTASAEERARRRVRDLRGRGIEMDFADVLRQIQARDAQDSGREVAPLEPAEDAVILDSSTMDLDAVVEELVRIVHSHAG